MLPSDRRLRTTEVQEVLARGKAARGVYLSAKILPTLHPIRVAAVISKKVAKKAVERNRLRRALYRALISLVGNGNVVIFIQKTPHEALVPAFLKDLTLLLQQNIKK